MKKVASDFLEYAKRKTMRLRDYQNLLNRAIPVIEQVKITEKASTYTTVYNIINIQAFVGILKDFKQAKLFLSLVNNFAEIPNLTNSIENSISVSSSSITKRFSNLLHDLYDCVTNFSNTLADMLCEENTDTLNLKLPEDYSSISDYKNFFVDLEDFCLPFKYFNVEVKVVNFDVGSEWIGIDFSEMTVALFLSLADKAASLYNKFLEGKKLIAEIKNAETSASEAKLKAIQTTIEILEKQKEEEFNDYKEQLIEEAIAESGCIINEKECNINEFKNHLRKAILKLGNLVIRGLEIVPALNAKPEIKELASKANKNIEANKKLIIGCDNYKYITMKTSDIKSKDIPADTEEFTDNK